MQKSNRMAHSGENSQGSLARQSPCLPDEREERIPLSGEYRDKTCVWSREGLNQG